MSRMRVYDCWEELVREVLKQEDYRRMCLAHSRESSIDSSSESSEFDVNNEDGSFVEIDDQTTAIFAIKSNITSWISDGMETDATTAITFPTTPPPHRLHYTTREHGNATELRGGRRRPNPRLSNPRNNIHGEQVAAGWPAFLSAVAGEAINGWTPRRADSFEKLDRIGKGTYSTVYKARDAITGEIVALKKVRFDNLEPESVRFMAREILILRRLDHPNVMKLKGLVTSRMSCSLYLVFDYMEHDLAGLASIPGINFTESQVKFYMHQLLSGLEHCHYRNVLHCDIKASDILINEQGVLKIADFGLATLIDHHYKHPVTSRAVTLRYKAPELLLGATVYGVGVDLWSAGCILAELFAGKPIMAGKTQMEQLTMIFNLCGSPSKEYWRQSKTKLPPATKIILRQPYKRCIREALKDFPPSSLPLIDTLLAIDPRERQTATAALKTEFFTTKPYACDPSTLPKYPPSKEMDAERRDAEAHRRRLAADKGQAYEFGVTKMSRRERVMLPAMPAPAANAELQANIDRRRLITHATSNNRTKFAARHQGDDLPDTGESSAPKFTWTWGSSIVDGR